MSQSTVSSFLTGKPVDYLNFLEICRVLEQEWRDLADLGEAVPTPTVAPSSTRERVVSAIAAFAQPALELPDGPVRLDSPFYLARPPIEGLCFDAIAQPGALIRIKAPRQMGKTSLLSRALQQATQLGYRTVNLNLQLANQRTFATVDTFLQWVCATLGLELGRLDSLNDCWQLSPVIGSNQCCKLYLEQQLLAGPAPPLTIGIDNLDRVFEFPEIAEDFLGLLRSLHEEAKRRPIWQKLGLVIAHATEVYLPLDINKSPFNVGLPIELPEFTAHQIETMAHQHRLDWSATLTQQLMALVGGHPHLIRLALYHSARDRRSVAELLQTAGTESGIYREHLQRHEWHLSQSPELSAAIQLLLKADRPIRLDTAVAYRLQGMGLIHLTGREFRIRYPLYEQYLRDRLEE